MSWEMVGRVIKDSKAENGALLVMIGLANYSNDDDQSWPAVASLAKIARLSERQVQVILRKLVQMGEIAQTGKGPKGTIRYKVNPGSGKPHPEETSPPQFPAEGGEVIAPSERETSPEPLKEPLDSEPLNSPQPAAAEAVKGEHKAFIERWDEAFEVQFGRRYVFAGGKDGMAVKRLLMASKKSAVDLMAIATKAWSKKGKLFWNCEKAISITGFCSRFNEILAELHRPMPGDVINHRAKTAPEKTSSGKLRLIDRPVKGWPHPDTGEPMSNAEVDQLYPLENYE